MFLRIVSSGWYSSSVVKEEVNGFATLERENSCKRSARLIWLIGFKFGCKGLVLSVLARVKPENAFNVVCPVNKAESIAALLIA